MPVRQNPDFGHARSRENAMLARLAGVVCDGDGLTGAETSEDLRQLGYAAHLARGRVDDPDNHLGRIVKACQSALQGQEPPVGHYRDGAQALWGAAWHLDATKLRTELPLHIRKRMHRSPTLLADPQPHPHPHP